MTEEKKFPELDMFNARMGSAIALEELVSKAKSNRISGKSISKAKKEVQKISYAYHVSKGTINPENPDHPKNPGAMPDELTYLGVEQAIRESLEDSSDLMSDGLEAIIEGANEDQLGKLVNDRTLEKAGSKWNKWAELYQGSVGAGLLVKSIKDGSMTDEQKSRLAEKAYGIYQEETLVSLKKKYGEARAHLAEIEARSKAIVMQISTRKSLGSLQPYLVKAAEGIAKEAKANLQKHQDKTGQNVRAYVADVVGKLMKGSEEDQAMAPGLLYQGTKKDKR